MKSFVHAAFSQRVIFGIDSVKQISVELQKLGISSALIISTSGQAKNVAEVVKHLGARVIGVFDKASIHVPVETVDQALAEVAARRADGVVTVGGGSAVGLAKMVALFTGTPILAVPTTYAGSEMTSIYGFTTPGAKSTGRNLQVLPKTVIYDPVLSSTLPSSIAAASGMNAIAHSVEALYAHDRNPMVAMLAEEAIRFLAMALPAIAAQPTSIGARSNALYGAWLAGSAFASVSMGLHHKLCHVLGGTFNLPHAESHSVVLPHVARYNERAAPDAMESIARALGTRDAAAGLFNLSLRLGLETKLSGLGMLEEELERASRLATQTPYPNPADINVDRVLDLLRNAYVGKCP